MEFPARGRDNGSHRIIAHGNHPLSDPQSLGQLSRGLAQAHAALEAGAQFLIAPNMALEVAAVEPVDLAGLSYVTGETQSEEDLRLTAILDGVSKYAVRDEERAKILNNLAIHFADTGRPELALHHFHRALETMLYAGERRFELARQVSGYQAQSP